MGSDCSPYVNQHCPYQFLCVSAILAVSFFRLPEMYLWLKFFHIFFVVSWFAGLFYLPRIFVNLSLAQHPDEYARLLLMAKKLYKCNNVLVLYSCFCMDIWKNLYRYIAGCVPRPMSLSAC